MAEINSFIDPKEFKVAKEYIAILAKGAKDAATMATALDKLSKATKTNKKSQKDLTAVEKEANALAKQKEKLLAKQDKSLNKITRDVIKQKEAIKEQNKQLREQAREDLGLKKRSNLFQSLTKSMVATAAIMGAVIGGLKLIWKEISRTSEFQQKWEQGLNASRASLDVLHGAIKNINNGGFKNFNKNLDDAIEKSIELTKRMQQTRVTIDIYSASLNRMAIREEILLGFADDATRSFQLREDAANRAYKIQEKRLLEQAKLTKRTYEEEKQLQKDQVDRGVTQTHEQIKRLKQLEIAFDNSLKERKTARLNYNKRIRELRLDDFEQELDYIFDVSDKRKTANEKDIADTRKTQEERQSILNETSQLLDESFNDQINLFNSFHGLQIDTNKLLTLNNKESFEYARGLGMSERATNRLLEVIRERIAATSDLNEAQKTLRDFDTISPVNIADNEAELTIKLGDEWDKRQAKLKDSLAKMEAEEKASEERKQALRDEFVNTTAQGVNVLFDLAQSRRDAELESIQNNYAARIEAAEGNTELQERLAVELETKQREINQRQAQSERNQALFNIVVNTAQGIMASIGQLGLPAATPFIALTTALGAIQSAAILSQPLPAFFAGTADTPFAFTAGEKGSELMIKKDGSVELTPDKTTLYAGKEYEHAQIIPNPETQRILAYNQQRNETNRIEKKLDRVVDAIENNKTNIMFSKNVPKLNMQHLKRKYGIKN